MRKIVLALVLLIAICLPPNSIAGEYFFDTNMDETLSTSDTKASKLVNLGGYKEFSVLVLITGGTANQTIHLNIMNSPTPEGGFEIAFENFPLSPQGQKVFKGVYRIYAPHISIGIKALGVKEKTPKVKVFVYAGPWH